MIVSHNSCCKFCHSMMQRFLQLTKWILVTWLVERMVKVEAGLILEVVEQSPWWNFLRLYLWNSSLISWTSLGAAPGLILPSKSFWCRRWASLMSSCSMEVSWSSLHCVKGLMHFVCSWCSHVFTFMWCWTAGDSKVQCNKCEPMETQRFVLVCHEKRTNGLPWWHNKWCSFAVACQNKNTKEKPFWREDSMLKHFFTSLPLHFHFHIRQFCSDDQTLLLAFSQGGNNHNYVKHVIH